jgi:hypothetical protein
MKVDFFTAVFIVFCLGVCATLLDFGTLFSTAEATSTEETRVSVVKD